MRFKKRFAPRLEGLPNDEGAPDVRKRLAHLDELEAVGTITAEEHM